MTSGSDDEPPTTPHRSPVKIVAVVAAVVVLLGGGAGAYILYGKTATNGKAPAAKAATTLDACAMVPQAEVDRLVPEATIKKDATDNEFFVDFRCEWVNNLISYGDFYRERRIKVEIRQYVGEGAETGRAAAEEEYALNVKTARRGEHPAPIKGEKTYYAPARELTGVGDTAFATYTWTRSSWQWLSYSETQARVGDMLVTAYFSASQHRKDSGIMSNETSQSVTEDNAIRESSAVATHVAQALGAWKAENPGVLAQPYASATISPSATPSPTALAAVPPICQAGSAEAANLVPAVQPTAKGRQHNGDAYTECVWENKNIDGGGGVKQMRAVTVLADVFTNRAGAADPAAAKNHYRHLVDTSESVANTNAMGNIFSTVNEVKGLGEAAFFQYVTQKKNGSPIAGACVGAIRSGATVYYVEASGSDVPAGKPDLDPGVKPLGLEEACTGGLKVARAMLQSAGVS